MHKNPFSLKEIPTTSAFCDRTKEMRELLSHAQAGTNVVIFSPRRYGKTSLTRRLQSKLGKDGYLIAFCDFFGVTSINDIAGRIAKSIYSITRHNESIFKKAIRFITAFRPVLEAEPDGNISISVEPATGKQDLELLDDTMASLEKFIQDIDHPVHIAFDEFQEIAEVSQSISVEGILRHYIQRIECSFFFIGSRRRILLEMFNQRKRPFFQSALNYELPPLRKKAVITFIQSQFNKGKKRIDEAYATMISELVEGHAYYMQKFNYLLFDSIDEEVKKSDIASTLQTLLDSERYVFGAILQGLSVKETVLLTAIASDPESKIFSSKYIVKHQLGSTGGTQRNLKTLSLLDLIEKNKDTKAWQIVDPFFKRWLLQYT